MNLLILSDIHGNQSAFQAVLDQTSRNYNIEACILLGDLIDYGPHSNEIIQMASHLLYPVICNIRGNHEDAIIRQDYDRFSSERGRASARYTRSILTSDSWDYMTYSMSPGGIQEFEFCGKKCLAVHGCLVDKYWKSLSPEDSLTEYSQYDYVFSGHSHIPHMVERFFPCGDSQRRNKKKVIFINPGSVGQPRNLNCHAQYAVLNMEREHVTFEKAEYDIAAEQEAFYRQGASQIDDFYRERLTWGI